RGRSRGKKLLLSHGPTEISWSLRSSRRGTVPMPAAIFRALNRRTRARLAAVPGPTPWFPLGTLGDFLGPWPWERCAEYGRRYGGVALVWLFNRPAVVLDDPDLIGQVLDTRAPTSTRTPRPRAGAGHHPGQPVHHQHRPRVGGGPPRQPVLHAPLRRVAHAAGRAAPGGRRRGGEAVDGRGSPRR